VILLSEVNGSALECLKCPKVNCIEDLNYYCTELTQPLAWVASPVVACEYRDRS
jgi:hypothetical protein